MVYLIHLCLLTLEVDNSRGISSMVLDVLNHLPCVRFGWILALQDIIGRFGHLAGQILGFRERLVNVVVVLLSNMV